MDKDKELGGTRNLFREGMPLRNPLPTPRRREHVRMDYDIEPEHDGVQDEFDLEIYPNDDFDV